MSSDNASVLREGFEAFMRCDVDTLRELIEPDAQWLYWEPIPGDCHDREKILATLRDRHEAGAVTGLKEIVDGGTRAPRRDAATVSQRKRGSVNVTSIDRVGLT